MLPPPGIRRTVAQALVRDANCVPRFELVPSHSRVDGTDGSDSCGGGGWGGGESGIGSWDSECQILPGGSRDSRSEHIRHVDYSISRSRNEFQYFTKEQ